MDIMLLPFESKLLIKIDDEQVVLTVFKTPEADNIKVGITAPFCIEVNREEIFQLKKQRLQQETKQTNTPISI